MKLSHLLHILHTMEPDATVAIRATGTNSDGETVKRNVTITHAEQIGAGCHGVVRLEADEDLTID